MDAESRESTRVLEAIAKCNEQFIALSHWLRSSGYKGVTQGVDCRAYETGTMLEAYVEAELSDGRIICWWLDISWNQASWRIASSVVLNNDDGQEVLKSFPDKTPITLSDFVDQLQEASSDLVGQANSLNTIQGFQG